MIATKEELKNFQKFLGYDTIKPKSKKKKYTKRRKKNG